MKEYWRYAPFNVVSPTGLLNFSPASEIMNNPFHFCSASQRKVKLLCEKQQLGQNTIFAQVVDFFCSLRLVALELDTLFYFVPDFHFVSDQKVSSSPSLSTNHDHSGPWMETTKRKEKWWGTNVLYGRLCFSNVPTPPTYNALYGSLLRSFLAIKLNR